MMTAGTATLKLNDRAGDITCAHKQSDQCRPCRNLLVADQSAINLLN